MVLLNLFCFISFLNTMMLVCFVKECAGQTLNISGETKGFCSIITRHKKNGLLVSTFIATKEDNITKIMDSSSTVWDAKKSPQKMYLFRVYSLDNIYLLGCMLLHNDDYRRTIYFRKISDIWFEILLYEFNIMIGVIERERSYDIVDQPNPACFKLEKHSIYGLPARVVLPLKDIELTSVKWDGEQIWKKENNFQKCKAVIIHGNENDPKFIHLHVKNAQFRDEIFFVKCDNGWIRTIKAYFSFLLHKMDREEEAKKRLANNNE